MPRLTHLTEKAQDHMQSHREEGGSSTHAGVHTQCIIISSNLTLFRIIVLSTGQAYCSRQTNFGRFDGVWNRGASCGRCQLSALCHVLFKGVIEASSRACISAPLGFCCDALSHLQRSLAFMLAAMPLLASIILVCIAAYASASTEVIQGYAYRGDN